MHVHRHFFFQKTTQLWLNFNTELLAVRVLIAIANNVLLLPTSLFMQSPNFIHVLVVTMHACTCDLACNDICVNSNPTQHCEVD